MSKSIYEEILEIIDKNIFELPEGFAVLYEIRKRIKQAQKQEKLLEQIKEITDKPYNFNVVSILERLERYDEIVKLIKELEND